MDLKAKEIEEAKFTFSLYDFDEKGVVDAFYLGPMLRVFDLTPSLAVIHNCGGTKRKGERSLKVEEFLAIYADVKKNKDSGTMDDFLECLRSSDKEGEGKISSDQLGHILQSYGERLDPEEVAEIIQDCGNMEDGLISYVPFLKNLMNGPETSKSSNSSHITKTQTNEEIPPLTMSSAKPIIESPSAEFTVKAPKQKSLSMPDEIKTPPAQIVANAAFTLKTPKARSPSVTEDTKAAATAAATAVLKPKNQMPLISMKTKGLIGNIK